MKCDDRRILVQCKHEPDHPPPVALERTEAVKEEECFFSEHEDCQENQADNRSLLLPKPLVNTTRSAPRSNSYLPGSDSSVSHVDNNKWTQESSEEGHVPSFKLCCSSRCDSQAQRGGTKRKLFICPELALEAGRDTPDSCLRCCWQSRIHTKGCTRYRKISAIQSHLAAGHQP